MKIPSTKNPASPSDTANVALIGPGGMGKVVTTQASTPFFALKHDTCMGAWFLTALAVNPSVA